MWSENVAAKSPRASGPRTLARTGAPTRPNTRTPTFVENSVASPFAVEVCLLKIDADADEVLAVPMPEILVNYPDAPGWIPSDN